jgi:outer membrane receptor protein involved in Fe transport
MQPSGCQCQASVPNGTHLPYYRQMNVGVSHAFDQQGLAGLAARLDVINVFDEKYQIRNGTGVGVGASQYGARRGYFAGLSMSF